nr:hypothetical protein CFP56_07878 [Quercus suber]
MAQDNGRSSPVSSSIMVGREAKRACQRCLQDSMFSQLMLTFTPTSRLRRVEVRSGSFMVHGSHSYNGVSRGDVRVLPAGGRPVTDVLFPCFSNHALGL